jgi:hypothetical protein
MPWLSDMVAELTMEPQRTKYGSSSIRHHAWKRRCNLTLESSPTKVFSCTEPQIVYVVAFPTKSHLSTLSPKVDLKVNVTPKSKDIEQKEVP